MHVWGGRGHSKLGGFTHLDFIRLDLVVDLLDADLARPHITALQKRKGRGG